MAAVDRAILRLGAHELLHRPELPPKVAIDEAIRIAKKFSTAESGAFVNGILDRVMATLPAEGRRSRGQEVMTAGEAPWRRPAPPHRLQRRRLHAGEPCRRGAGARRCGPSR